MERNCGRMRNFARSGFLVCLLLFSVFAHAQQRQNTISPTVFGSVTQGTPSNETISLSISNAIDRALKYNLGPLIAGQETRVAAAERVRALSELLPKINVTVTGIEQQIDLAAFGFTSFPGVPSVIGPFSVFDARAHFAETPIEFRYLHEM